MELKTKRSSQKEINVAVCMFHGYIIFVWIKSTNKFAGIKMQLIRFNGK